MKTRGVFRGIIVFLCMFVLAVSFVFAQPSGPSNITVTESGRNVHNGSAALVIAQAGNVTGLNVIDQRVTQSWQGYYGNITGTIVLDDANNNTFFDWSLPAPSGEIYAANHSNVFWTDVYCMNVSSNRGNLSHHIDGFVTNTNGSLLELDFGINNTDFDGLNETFNNTYDGSFNVGSITIDANDGCSETNLYTDESRNSNWREIILTDNATIIFTSIIAQNTDGFRPGTETSDFQMIVIENGHTEAALTNTNYYFFVELN